MQSSVTLFLPSMFNYIHAKSLNFVLECCDAAYTNRNAFYGRTACTNVGRFSRSWGERFDQRGTGLASISVVFPTMNGYGTLV